MEELAPGSIIDAVVVQIEPYGAWVDHGGQRGLITIPEVSWSRIRHPGEALSVGQRVRAKVLGVAAGEFSASIRAAHPELDPWRDPESFGVGATFVGPVVLVTDYGCFVELRPDVRGLLRRERCPEGVCVGDRLRVAILSVDAVRGMIELDRLPLDAA
ncbi:S1 RNA-binding domain-containing protein [Tundrisphaera sp. TA3]|uniref:S1 RNA-binding domain-containing protein n=1 Tax=Tundrisphaera sp. TA3 TaxID=3435775 RepID=UPI003EB84EFE